MAEIVSAVYTSHSPLACYSSPTGWSDVRARRPIRADVPVDSEAENLMKAQRVSEALETLRGQIEASALDVVVIFGDDQLECFDFANCPSISIFLGEEFSGTTKASAGEDNAGEAFRVEAKAHPELARYVAHHLVKAGFDLAFSTELPKPEKGMSHSVMLPLGSLTDLSIPVVPILLNCYYAPQVTGRRSFELGRAVAGAIHGFERTLRVGVVGSGGLWHTPMMPDSYIDLNFDQAFLGALAKGDALGMAELFDSYEADGAAVPDRLTGVLGSPGPQGGTREVCNWISAAAATEGTTPTFVDYLPVYASPIGLGFAYWSGGRGDSITSPIRRAEDLEGDGKGMGPTSQPR